MSAMGVCRIFERKTSKRAKRARVSTEGVSNAEEAMEVIDFTVECGTETSPPPPPGTP